MATAAQLGDLRQALETEIGTIRGDLQRLFQQNTATEQIARDALEKAHALAVVLPMVKSGTSVGGGAKLKDRAAERYWPDPYTGERGAGNKSFTDFRERWKHTLAF